MSLYDETMNALDPRRSRVDALREAMRPQQPPQQQQAAPEAQWLENYKAFRQANPQFHHSQENVQRVLQHVDLRRGVPTPGDFLAAAAVAHRQGELSTPPPPSPAVDAATPGPDPHAMSDNELRRAMDAEDVWEDYRR